MHIGLQDRFLLLALVGILLAHPHDGAQRLDVEARALGLRIDVADVVGDRLLFLLQPLDALDEGLELILAESDCRLVVLGGGSSSDGRHRSLLPFTQHRVSGKKDRESGVAVKRAAPSSTRVGRSSTVRTPRPWTISASALLFRMWPASPRWRPSGTWPSSPRTACRRSPHGSRPWSSARPWRRRLPSSSWTGSSGRSRRGSSCRYSARRCATADARGGAGTRRLRARCGSCHPWPFLRNGSALKIVARGSACQSRTSPPPRARCGGLALLLRAGP